MKSKTYLKKHFDSLHLPQLVISALPLFSLVVFCFDA